MPALLITHVVINYYAGFAHSSLRFLPTPVWLTVGQWLVLVALPVLSWAISVLVVRRGDKVVAHTMEIAQK